MPSRPPPAMVVALVIFGATTVQLAVGTFFADELTQFADKGFAARLVAYPLLMAALPVGWGLRRRRRGSDGPLPWGGFALVMAPFLVDVTGNTLDLYDSVGWWDNANHLANWFLLCAGIGLLLLRATPLPEWALGWLVAGIGALLAIGWEVGEWYTFIRHGTEIETAYSDTLSDLVLGALGGVLAAFAVTWYGRASRTPVR